MVVRVRRLWWVVAAVTAVAVGVAALPELLAPTRYESTGSYLVVADVDDPGNLVRATATLLGGDEAVNTFVAMARSDRIEEDARAATGTDDDALEVIARTVTGTNMLELGVTAGSPDVARAMAVAVGAQTRRYVRVNTRLFQLETVDAPGPARRVRDVPDPLRLGGVGVLAAVVSAAGALALTSTGRWAAPARPGHVVDPTTGARSRRYLRRRLHEERVRHGSDHRPFCVGVLAVVDQRMPGVREPAPLDRGSLAHVRSAIGSTLLPYDVLAYLGDSRFVALLPMTDLDDARARVDAWRRAVDDAVPGLLDSRGFGLEAAACTYDASDWSGDPLAERTVREL